MSPFQAPCRRYPRPPMRAGMPRGRHSFPLTRSPPALGFLSSGSQKERERERESQRPAVGGCLGPGGHDQGAGERCPGRPWGGGVGTCRDSSGDPRVAPGPAGGQQVQRVTGTSSWGCVTDACLGMGGTCCSWEEQPPHPLLPALCSAENKPGILGLLTTRKTLRGWSMA